MIRTMGLTTNEEWLFDFTLEELSTLSLQWYWVDFDRPSLEEESLLHSFFQFHPLAIEDCLQRLQRPKMDYYDGYAFFVLHSLCQDDLEAEELNLFLGEDFVVTFHYNKLQELPEVRDKIVQQTKRWDRGSVFLAYLIMDKVVDFYFPILYQIEDHLNDVEEQLSLSTVELSMDYVFEVRSDLLRLRRTIYPMRELLYRVLNSDRLGLTLHEQRYFKDIYDHLLRLGEIIESNRELTADIRDSQLSINSNRMNSIMMTLTIISSIFIPLTFIAGVYGMNFDHMPELHWHYGYFIVLAVMLLIGVSMLLWFKYKGWLRI
ncbi:magnesium and cobalt transporter cora [Bacillus sp. OxB-1]|uniref:magnesium/cobalt transporter CorA n=1 Tax=Bacillus sp. (strain OxB-1) TaxID=98228 RepID=UPI000581D21C|nr:magnesium/cobalt transporter CorA [Bacillus sp. OxB-1]BAQ11951.1 magnesium and cobalt transporter cora [Bacillus sp. OxB-1]